MSSIKINENIKLWKDNSPFEKWEGNNQLSLFNDNPIVKCLVLEKERIAIKDRWFDVINHSELVRMRNTRDGYYRVVYIQLNMKTGEYYIGKANRPGWSELLRYKGSGLKFKSKFNTHEQDFVRYYIAAFNTAEETEQLESSLVDKDLLADELCLNLVAGGGGTTKHPTKAETSAKKRAHMLNNPHQYRPMIETAKKLFLSGDTQALRSRSERIKEVMSDEKYRSMTRDRINKWRDDKPHEYLEARRKNREAIRSSQAQEKRKESLANWKKANPEAHKAWEAKRLDTLKSEASKNKRKASLKTWARINPEQAAANIKNRAKAAAKRNSKAVCMIDLQSREVIKTFPSQHAAARWLIEEGRAKNKNCVSCISSVCNRAPCTTGYGFRRKAYGYDWRFETDVDTKGSISEPNVCDSSA